MGIFLGGEDYIHDDQSWRDIYITYERKEKLMKGQDRIPAAFVQNDMIPNISTFLCSPFS